MATIENCPEYNNCGFIKFLINKRGLVNPDCGKNTSACGRLNPIVPLDITVEGTLTHEETETAFPVLYVNEEGRSRRVLRGTHY